MMLNDDQMKRQIEYESVLYSLKQLYKSGIILFPEFKDEVEKLEKDINPIIKHNSLLYQE